MAVKKNNKRRKHRYLEGRISRGFNCLFSSRMIATSVISLTGLFVPIFLYELFGYQLRYVIYYYLASCALYLFVVAWGAKYLNKIGLRRSLRISIVWGALFYFCFYFLSLVKGGDVLAGKWSVLALIALALIFLTIHRSMYWLPFHTDLAKFTNRRNRGKQISLLYGSSMFLMAVMPIVAGLILMYYDYSVLFLLVILIFLTSVIPLITIPRTRERFRWGYFETWKKLFCRERLDTTLAFMGDGAENAIRLVVWPIFIWKLLEGDYFQVGLITGLVIVLTIILQLLAGQLIDKRDKKRMLKTGVWLYASGWVIKMFIASAFHIFLASAYHGLAQIFTRTPFDSLQYEKAADQGHFVDEFTVIHEMAFMMGRILMLLAVLVLTSFVSLNWTFILAAVATLVMNFILREDHIYLRRAPG